MLQTTVNKNSYPALVSISEYETRGYVMVFACTKTGLMLPLDASGKISASHPFLSAEIGPINCLNGDEYTEILNKRVRAIARAIIEKSSLQEVHVPRKGQMASAAAMTKLKKRDKNMKIYQIMLLRAEVEEVPDYIHVPYEGLSKNGRLCPIMKDIIEQLEHFECFEDFASRIEDEED